MREGPSVVFLQETKMTTLHMECVRATMGFDCCFAVACEGRSGGLDLLWKNEINLSIKSFSFYHIDAEIQDDERGIVWKLSGLYGHQKFEKRGETWSFL